MNLFKCKLECSFLFYKNECFNFYTMDLRGGFKEALSTRVKIDFKHFVNFYNLYRYEFYGFDERINCYRYCISDVSNNYLCPFWLLVEPKGECLKSITYYREVLKNER